VREAAVCALVIGGVALQLLAVAGVTLLREPLDRLHYAGPAGLGAACVAAAVLVQGGWSFIGLRAILVAALSVATGPLLGHVTARAIHATAARGR
jgi:multisubunit Na+/H+ antiporter MnhG subunit